MKKTLKITLILLLICSTVTTMLFMLPNKKQSSDISHTDISSVESVRILELVLSDKEISLQEGESHTCTVTFDDGSNAAGVKWSSSDESVATVNSDGTITAISPGKTVITAYLSEKSRCTANVKVYANEQNSVADLIIKLAENGDDDSYNQLLQLKKQLEKSDDASSKKYDKFISALLDYSKAGAGENKDSNKLWNTLISALDDTEINSITKKILRRAALSVYCQGEKNASDVTLTFTGDCTFAYFNETDKEGMFPDIYRKSGSVSYPFDLTKNVFGADDITMINFEGTLTDATEHREKTFFFRGEPSYVDILTHSSVEAVTVENNHSFDYKDSGFKDTLKHLRNAGIRYTSLTSPSAIRVGEYRTVMLSLSLVSTTYKPEFQKRIENYIAEYNTDKTIIVINVHWGVEGSDTPEQWQIDAAHSMIDAGADLIVGHHPHRLQGIEQYKGKYIAYSLGNFSFGGNNTVSNPDTIILRTSFSHSDKGMILDSFSAIPCYTTSTGTKVNNYQPIVRFGENGGNTISNLLALSKKLDGGIESIKWNKIK